MDRGRKREAERRKLEKQGKIDKRNQGKRSRRTLAKKAGKRGTGSLLVWFLAASMVLGSFSLEGITLYADAQEVSSQESEPNETSLEGDSLQETTESETLHAGDTIAEESFSEDTTEVEDAEDLSAAGEDQIEDEGLEGEPSETQTVTDVEDYLAEEEDLADADELFEGYVEQEFFGESGLSLLADYAASYLDGYSLEVYYALKSCVTTAAAEGGSTIFTITLENPITWSTDGTYSDTSYLRTEAKEQLTDVIDFDAIMDCLLMDCPYELYWYDKTQSTTLGYTITVYRDETDGTITGGSIGTLVFTMQVSSDYQDTSSEDPSTTIDAQKASAASEAAAVAQALVAEHAQESDLEKLQAYLDYICEAVSYDEEAASDDTADYGDPWQLISVFDEDPDTNVTCEGYAKAFQYLCDLSDFENDIVCYTVIGTSSGGLTTGGHMWNIVSINGTSYLVDVTNSDSGTVGVNGGLFLVGSTDGSALESYTFIVGDTQAVVIYTYGEDSLALYGEDILTLGASDYEVTYVVQTEVEGVVAYYETIRAAFDAVEGQTAVITLLDDVVTSGTLYVSEGDDFTLVSEGENSYTLSSEKYISNLLYISGGSLTIDGVNVENTAQNSSGSAGKAIYLSSGDLSVNDSAIEAGKKGIYLVSGSAEIDGGSSVTATEYAIQVKGGTLEILDGTYEGTSETSSALYVSGGSVSLSGGTFTGGTSAIETVVADGAVEDLLAEGYGYLKDSEWVSDEGLEAASLTGTVTVALLESLDEAETESETESEKESESVSEAESETSTEEESSSESEAESEAESDAESSAESEEESWSESEEESKAESEKESETETKSSEASAEGSASSFNSKLSELKSLIEDLFTDLSNAIQEANGAQTEDAGGKGTTAENADANLMNAEDTGTESAEETSAAQKDEEEDDYEESSDTSDESVETGDMMVLGLWIVILIVACVTAVCILVYKRKARK